ncbi:MAG: protein jag [Deltaproteobacteria bacterium]|nr:protein jag [Deltaproteobacteria bacterium]MBW2135996.1 protein jag [Deltaproteobacteria bacterium]
MAEYEFEGKTTEEAIENAARELDVPAEDLNFEIIEPGSAGIFGLVGGKKAKIKVTLEGIETKQEENGLMVARETLERILTLIPLEAKVHAVQEDGSISLNIEGDTSGLLIGRRGKTLDALQFIVNKIVNKALDKKVQVVVDSENYRKRRREALNQMALKMGERAKRTKKPVTTDLLNPHDRRIVHLTLKDDDKLETRSRGEGLLKKVVIIPKK